MPKLPFEFMDTPLFLPNKYALSRGHLRHAMHYKIIQYNYCVIVFRKLLSCKWINLLTSVNGNKLLFSTALNKPHVRSPHPNLFYMAVTSNWKSPKRTHSIYVAKITNELFEGLQKEYDETDWRSDYVSIAIYEAQLLIIIPTSLNIGI